MLVVIAMRAILEVRSVSKSFGRVSALCNVSATFFAGVVCALVGPNGCGKTTLLNILSGFYRAASGQVFWRGSGRSRLLSKPASWRARFGIGRMFQEPRGFPEMTVEDNLLIAMIAPGSDCVAGRGLCALPRRTLSSRVDELLDLGHLLGYRRTTVAELSFGQRRILDLLVLMARSPQVYLLDEPFAGVDPLTVDVLCDLIRGRASRAQSTIILVSHEIGLVQELADRLLVMDAGRIVMRGAPPEVVSSERFRSLYLS